MLNRRQIFWVAVAATAGWSGAAAAKEPVHVQISGGCGATDPACMLMVKTFNDTHPDIVAELDPSPPSMGQDLASMSKFMIQVIGGHPAAIANVDRFNVPAVAARHLLLDLTPFIKADGYKGSDWYPAVWGETQFEGGTYALPRSTDDRPLFYNKTMFSNAGLDPNKPPATWEDLAQYQRKLTTQDANGKLKTLGINPLWNQGWFYMWGWANGGHFVSKDLKSPTFDDPAIVEALTYLQELYRDVGGIQAMGAVTQGLDHGTLAMAFQTNGGFGGYANTAAKSNNFDFGVAYPPVPAARLAGTGRFAGMNPHMTWSGGWSWGIPVGVQDPQAAWEVLKWITSPQAWLLRAEYSATHQAQGAVYYPGMTGNRIADQQIFNRYLPNLAPDRQTGMNFMLNMMNVSQFRPHSPLAPELWEAQDKMAQEVAHLTSSPQEAATKWQAWLEGKFADYYKNGSLESGN